MLQRSVIQPKEQLTAKESNILPQARSSGLLKGSFVSCVVHQTGVGLAMSQDFREKRVARIYNEKSRSPIFSMSTDDSHYSFRQMSRHQEYSASQLSGRSGKGATKWLSSIMQAVHCNMQYESLIVRNCELRNMFVPSSLTIFS